MNVRPVRSSANLAAGSIPILTRRILALAVLCACVGVGSAQPFSTSLLDTARVVGPDEVFPYTSPPVYYTASAIGDSTGLVVWRSDEHVKGCLVTSGRTSSTTACIDISGPGDRAMWGNGAVDAARSPEGYLVVWPDDGGNTLLGAVVSLGGEVVMRETVARYSVGNPIANPAIAFDGTNYLVAWEESYDVYSWVLCTRVSPTGEVLDSPHKVCPAGSAQSSVSLSAGYSCFLAAYLYRVPGQADSSGVRCSRILPSGVVLDSAGIPIRHWPGSGMDNSYARTTVGFDSMNFVVGWSEYVQPAGDIRTARVTPSGVVLDSEGLVADSALEPGAGVSSACVRDTTLLVWTKSWNDTVTISGKRLSGAGKLLDTNDIAVTPPVCAQHSDRHADFASVSRCGEGFLVVYSDGAPSSGAAFWTRDVLGRRVSAAGQVLDTTGTLLSYAANYQTEADVASDGQDYLAVWTDLRTGSTGHDCAIYGTRFSNDGRPLDPSSFRISQWSSHAPSVAYGADCYLVSWLTDFGEDSSQLWAARIGRDGVPLDTSPIRLPGTQLDYMLSLPDVAFGDSLFLVVWSDPFYYGHGRGARVKADGTLLDSVPISLDIGNLGGWNPHVASDGHDFLVVRLDGCILHIYGVRVGSSGQVLDTTAIMLGRYGNSDYFPNVVFGAGVYLVVEPWASHEAWRVTPGGVVLDSIHFPHDFSNPQVAYDGTNFFLVDEDIWSNGLAHGFRAARITPQGEVMDSLKFNIIDLRPESTYLPVAAFAMTANLQGHVGMVFPTYESDPYVSSRIRASAFPAVVGAIDEQASAMPRGAWGARIISSATPLVVTEPAVLLDITGRKVAALRRGKNDISRLAPGVYFVREASGVGREASSVHKVVITK